jgi:hypothetical protein
MVELIEIAPGRWRVKRTPQNFARSEHPRPFIISDAMPPTEQVDGVFYESKSAFRAVGKQLGLIEVGNEKPKPRTRPSAGRDQDEARVKSVKKAVDRMRSK